MTTDEKIEYLIRKLERGKVISNLYQALQNCDEDARECDVCVGIRYSIKIVERMK